jgi:hypothetical protein
VDRGIPPLAELRAQRARARTRRWKGEQEDKQGAPAEAPSLGAGAQTSRHRLSRAHVQMAQELGLNPKQLGSIDNHDQEPWKEPLPQFIEHLYQKRFGRERPASGRPRTA